MKRGIIAAPGVLNSWSGGFELERMLDLDEMRYYALYWDEVVIPNNNIISLGLP